MATLPGYPDPVWYAADGIANVLSLSKVTKHYKITYNSENNNTFTMHCEDPLHFTENLQGLFHIDTSTVNGTILLSTVKD